MFELNRNEYWQAYRDVTQLPVEPFDIPQMSQGVEYEPLHWSCVYCHEIFPTIECLHRHYKDRNVDSDTTLIPRSRRGYTAESWARGQKRFNAPTIRAISKD